MNNHIKTSPQKSSRSVTLPKAGICATSIYDGRIALLELKAGSKFLKLIKEIE